VTIYAVGESIDRDRVQRTH